MKSRIFKSVMLLFVALNFYTELMSQTSGVFGASTDAANSNNKWIKFGELTLNGNYSNGGILIEFLPKNGNHGDSHQVLNAMMRNSTSTIESTYDLSIVTLSGSQRTIKDAKLVKYSGSGVTNNKISLWIQMASSHVSSVPINVRTQGSATFQVTNQPFYASITEAGTQYAVNSSWGMTGSVFTVFGNIRTKEVKVENVTGADFVFEHAYDLMPLDELSEFLKINKHLPEIAPAGTMQREGLDLGYFSIQLLQKIEELTLYTLAQQKAINELKEELEKLKQD